MSSRSRIQPVPGHVRRQRRVLLIIFLLAPAALAAGLIVPLHLL